MKPLNIADAPTIECGLQDEIWRSEESRYERWLHSVLLVAQRMRYSEAARLLGDATPTVANWIKRFEAEGLAGLVYGERPGRPSRLRAEQGQFLVEALRMEPRNHGLAGTL